MASAGSIAFTGFNVDSPNGTGGDDNIAFVALEAIAAGAVIYFQDNEWNGSAFTTGEGFVTWTASSAIAAGTIVTIDNLASGTIASNLGTATRSGSFNLSGTDEQIYAFEGNSGTTPTVFLTALANNLFTSASATLAGTGLTAGVNAVAFGTNADIGAYTGARAGEAAFGDYATVINTASNWVLGDGGGSQAADGTAPDVPFATTAFTIAAPPAGPVILEEAPSLVGFADTPIGTDTIDLQRLGSIASSSGPVAAGAESVAFDAATGPRAYVTNAAADVIDIVEIGADGSLTNVGSIALAGLTAYGEVNSVAVKNGVVAVAYQNANAQAPGYVALFDANGNFVKDIVVGALPDQLTFSPDGTKLLVANEGEPTIPVAPLDATTVDPEGTVTIIDMSGGAAGAAVSQTIGFTALNGMVTELRAAGTPLGVPGTSVAQNFEPEYIAVSPDGTTAYVTIQEANIVAVIDLTDPAATGPVAVLPLGGVDRNLIGNAFDPSDRDGIDLGNFNVKSLLMPDAIATFEVAGATYFVTANEGDARDYPGYVDEIRAGSSSYVLDPTVYPNAATLKGNNELGRLNVLRYEGDTDMDGDIDQITTYGGRGISIFRQEADGTITKVRETGGEFEAIFARDFPTQFNAENGAGVDSRSDNKGPEPEGVTVGEVNGRLYAFVSLERAGGVMIYDVTDPANATYVGYKIVNPNDYAPEVITFISAADSPTGQAIVLSANEVSGTLTLFSVRQNFNGTNAAETLVGTAFDDALSGFESNDVLRGLAGNDKLDGGADSDTLDGGEGADDIIGGAGIDTITFINATNGVSASLQTGTGTVGEAAGDRYRQVENIEGSDFHDVLEGDTGANIIWGRDGDDVITGFGGGDELYGEDGDDQFILVGAPDQLIIDGGRDFDTVLAGRDDTVINFNALANIEAIGGNGFANVRIFGSGFIDLSGMAVDGIASINSFGGADTIIGSAGADRIFSGGGKDVIDGGAGNDTLVGGDKTDILTGGDGADFFALLAAGDSVASIRKADTITDFDVLEGDLLDFSAIDAIAGGTDDSFTWAGFNGLTGVAGQASYYVKGGAAFVGGDIDGDGSYDFLVKLDGVTSIDAAAIVL